MHVHNTVERIENRDEGVKKNDQQSIQFLLKEGKQHHDLIQKQQASIDNILKLIGTLNQ